MKKFTIKAISTNVDGNNHAGRVKIEGTRLFRFTVYCQSREKIYASDNKPNLLDYLIGVVEQVLQVMTKCRY